MTKNRQTDKPENLEVVSKEGRWEDRAGGRTGKMGGVGDGGGVRWRWGWGGGPFSEFMAYFSFDFGKHTHVLNPAVFQLER